MLHSLASWWSESLQVLERALAQCDPEIQEFRLHQMARLMSSLEERLGVKTPESTFTMVCPLMGGRVVNEVDLIISQNATEVGRWSISNLLETSCGGDPEGAADAVVADLLGGREESNPLMSRITSVSRNRWRAGLTVSPTVPHTCELECSHMPFPQGAHGAI
jgi:hypothetical protein